MTTEREQFEQRYEEVLQKVLSIDRRRVADVMWECLTLAYYGGKHGLELEETAQYIRKVIMRVSPKAFLSVINGGRDPNPPV